MLIICVLERRLARFCGMLLLMWSKRRQRFREKAVKVSPFKHAVQGHPHLCGFFLLSVFLGLPFFLRTTASRLEIYPSIVLPVRASLAVSDERQIIYDEVVLMGQDAKTGILKPLDSLAFLDPIPVQNLGELVLSDFSLGDTSKKRVAFKYIPLATMYVPWAKSVGHEKTQTRDWLRQRLVSQGCRDNRLMILRTRTTRDRLNPDIVSTEILYEKDHRLD